MKTKHTCEGHVFHNYWSRPCGKSAAHEHEGHWYCKTHHPPTVAAKIAARSELLQAKWDAERGAARAKRLAADEQKRRADCYDDLLDALKYCAAVFAGEITNKRGLIEALEKARTAMRKAAGEQP